MDNRRDNRNLPFDRWVWIDLEMTGLNEESCEILQIAAVVTDPNFNEFGSVELVIWQPESVLERISPFVRDMHTKNGLLKRVRNSNVSLEQAESEVLALVCKHVPYKRGVLVGNSMYVDRRFLQKYMPGLENYLHYRQVDVSSFKVACQEWYGPKGKVPKKNSTHTALEDIRACMEELRFYKENCFRPT